MNLKSGPWSSFHSLIAGKHPGTPIREAAEASNPIIPVGSRSDSKRTLKGCFDELDLLLEL